MERDRELVPRCVLEDVVVLSLLHPIDGDALVVEEPVGGKGVLEHVDLAEPAELAGVVLGETNIFIFRKFPFSKLAKNKKITCFL